ncbi:RNA polymerase sigma factor [Actinomadura craniellae]|uniref:RNA polymerase sigma factor n=1 Tax=Actinomadura craniellae TaxID=2231787 RepID=A0A365H4A8_9ACTN|nr:RNA polymerase sigma factor [Actinomadura craniellae]RAY13848.1 RNA polymerase sigma factor [Actinomadura craniellae]
MDGVAEVGGTGRPAAHPAPGEPGAELGAALHAARAGDEDAFRLLYRAVQPRLLRYVRTLAPDDAEDVASEAWLQIARDLRSFQGDFDDFRGWAATVARHRALDLLRARRRRPVAEAGVAEMAVLPAADDTAALALDGLTTEATIALISQLPRDQAEAVLLRVLLGLDARTAGEVLGKRAGAVRTAAYRGLRRLAERLEGRSDAAGAPRAEGRG